MFFAGSARRVHIAPHQGFDDLRRDIARVLLEAKLKLVERPMPYAERVGESKLSVYRDGIRFLTSIIQAAAPFQPARPEVR